MILQHKHIFLNPPLPYSLLYTFILIYLITPFMNKFTTTSHPNIAIIKYWGKENIDLNIPSNSSISFPLTKLITTTTIEYNEVDKFILNDKQEEIPLRMKSIISKFRKIVNDQNPILITSYNNFPSNCGISSSASGYSALVKALHGFYKTKFEEKDLSILARMCSGSASRSIPKGIVLCNKEYSVSLGDLADIKIFLIIISDKPKSVSSTEGMILTQNSSFFYKDRLNRIDDKIKLCIESIKTKDYSSLFRMIIRDSNELHSMMFETYPPIRYITDEGYKIMTLIYKFNKNENLIAYSFDAGPNPFLFTLKENVNDLKELLKDYELKECN